MFLEDRVDRQGSGALRFAEVSLKDGLGKPVGVFTCGSAAVFQVTIANFHRRALRSVRIAVGIDNDLGQRVLVWSTHLADRDFPELPADAVNIQVRIPRMTLAPGRYGFTLFSSVNQEIADWVKNAGTFDVEAGDFYGSGQMPPQGQGYLVMEHDFHLAPVESKCTTAPTSVG